MSEYNKGSEWRRWDLHIHTPDTVKNDCFTGSNSPEKWENFITSINSYPQDISVVGITDYLLIDNFLKFIKYYESGNITRKIDLILPNIELRIAPISGDRAVNIHCIFNTTIVGDLDSRFYGKLIISHGGTEYTATKTDLIRLARDSGETGNNDELIKKGVSLFVIDFDKLQDLFKRDPDLRNNCLIFVANGSRDGATGVGSHQDFLNENGGSDLRMRRQSIYRFVDGIFSGNPRDRDYFIGKGPDNRKEVIDKYGFLKPCIHGSDAHKNTDIFNPNENRFCWIKADPTFEGLIQIIHEPEERIYIGEEQPDKKLPYQYIDKVEFIDSNGGTIFDTKEIQLNSNLNAIIGSRSSGKSALLAYIASRVDPDFTKNNSKPGAGIKWEDVENIECKVYWGNGEENEVSPGQVTYIPQSYLVEFSEDQRVLEEKIIPLLENNSGSNAILEQHNQSLLDIKIIDQKIIDSVVLYFKISETIERLKKDNLGIGDKESIQKVIAQKEEEVKKLQSSGLSKAELELIYELTSRIKGNKDRISYIQKLLGEFTDYERRDIKIEITTFGLPDFAKVNDLGLKIREIEEKKKSELVQEIKSEISEFTKIVTLELESLQKEEEKIRVDNETLIKKFQANRVLEKLLTELGSEKKKIEIIELNERKIIELESSIVICIEELKMKIEEKEVIFEQIKNLFSPTIGIDEIKIGIEVDINTDSEDRILSELFDRRRSPQCFIKIVDTNWAINREDLKDNLNEILHTLFHNPSSYAPKVSGDTIAKQLLTINKEVRFYGELAGDKIGGFHPTSMSQGKQSLFALMLILGESNEKWPLLIDQPEDDLDARSIYDEIVPFLKIKKKERQIIMVSHNANLVISADAEEIIVSNKDSTQRPNINEFTFNYKTGSIESSKEDNGTIHDTLEKKGIREHACEILDGGTEAFEKRRNKYSI